MPKTRTMYAAGLVPDTRAESRGLTGAEYARVSASRFWARVEKSDGCWTWIGYTVRGGYGQMFWAGRRVGAHRLSWMLAHGDVPNGLHVLHRCDNPRCVNPAHLFLGTHDDNMRDRSLKGRVPGSQKTRCFHGHLFTPENTRRENGRRHCRACARLRTPR